MRFGGDWTETKLDVISKYLSAYTKALKDKPSKEHPFRKGYIDAFAGTGSRDARYAGESDSKQLVFPDLAEDEPQRFLEGSATRALRTDPPFDNYVFIEKKAARCAELERLKGEFSDLADRIQIREGDANLEIQALCSKSWRSHRAVLFLDPFGMQVEWKTIKAIAETKAIDLWLLFPIGIGVNRLLTRSGDIPKGWRRRLDLLLGTTDWYDEFYSVETTPGLFGNVERVVKKSQEIIGGYFTRRLAEVFAAVAKPKVLKNGRGSPLFLLCFAVGNESGAKTALRIANHILKDED